MGRWTAVAILAAAQFVMVLDSSVMNVSISQIVADLDTTIQGVQLAITAYTLVMAAFMLVGAKIGDIWGREKAFAVGLAVYGTGSFITAISPNLGVLLFGWSLIEGLGAVMVIPAIAALIAANYEGKERALAYGIIGGIAAAAIAVGPSSVASSRPPGRGVTCSSARSSSSSASCSCGVASSRAHVQPTCRSSTSSERRSRRSAWPSPCSASSAAARGAGSGRRER